MNERADDVRRAYAVFGLPAGAHPRQIRRRYKALARQWHPDRHAREARNQAEAAARMREINTAYRCLADHLAGKAGGVTPPATAFLEGAPGGASTGRPLSRQELDRLVQAIGSEGPIDWLLDVLGRVGGALQRTLVAVFVMACVLRVAILVSSGGTGAVFRDRTLFLSVALLALLLVRELTARRALHR
jgi:hypothetical protein